MPHHLDAVPPDDRFDPIEEWDEADEPDDDADDLVPFVRPTWWRWVAIAVVLALVLAGPLAILLYRLLT